MSQSSNMSRVISRILSDSCLSKSEVAEVFKELGRGDDGALAEQMIEITRRENEFYNQYEERKAKLSSDFTYNLEYHRKQHMEKLLALEHHISEKVQSRNMALDSAVDSEDKANINTMYGNGIYNDKLQRQKLLDDFTALKNELYQDWKSKERALLAELRETKLNFEQERINARKAYHEAKSVIVDKWLMIINERQSMEGGAV